MSKDTFYFSHDYNSRSDKKIKKLLMKHGILGYGIFWSIIEDLYNNANALPTDYDCIAFDLRVDCDVIKSVINDFDLFVINDNKFGSLSVQKRIDERNEKSIKARESAICRWSKKDENANALRPLSDSNAIKERKGKENKVNIKQKKEPKNDGFISFSDFETKVKEKITNEKLIIAFTKYFEMRIAKKKQMTAYAVDLQINKLKKWFDKKIPVADIVESIDNSTVALWTDIYEPKKD